MGEHPRIDVTVDAVVLSESDGEVQALVVRRGNPPFEGRWALPGGFLEPDEDLAPAAARELEEETGVSVVVGDLRQLGAYGEPGRDPRGPTVSIAHLVELDAPAEAAGGSDASDAAWRPVRELLDDELAFDHATILRDGLSASRWSGR